MIYRTNKELRKWLREGGWWTFTLLPFFVFKRAAFEKSLKEVNAQHQLARPCARAAYRLLTYQKRPATINLRDVLVLGWMLLVLVLLAGRGHAQTAVNIDRVGGVKQSTDTIKVNCTVGCSASAGFADNAAFAPGTTSINVTGYEVDDVATTACTENSACAPRMSGSRIIYIDLSKSPANTNKFLVTADPITFASPQHTICDSGCGSSSFADSSAFTFTTTSVTNISGVVDDVGTNTVAENSAGALRMNTNRILYIDLSKTVANTNKLMVTADAITFASPQHVIADASAAVIGHVIADTGSTTAVTGNVTVVQPTGTNLHAVLDATSTTAATQATGTNLHTVTDATSVTTATLAAETTKVIGTVRLLGNSGAVVDAAQNAAVAANSVLAGCNFTTAPASVASGNQGATQCNSKGELLTQLTDGTTNVAVIAATTALKTDLSSIAGTATPTGNGTAATSQRVTIASDNTAFAIKISQTTTDNDVDVTSEVPGTGATNLGKAEDAAHTTGDVGVMALGVRKDTNSQTTNADGDYAQEAVDAYGVLYARNDHPNRVECTADNIAATLTQLTNCGVPGAGLSIYVTDIISISTTTTAGNTNLQVGTGSNCGTGTAAFYPPVSTSRIFLSPASTSTTGPLQIHFNQPRKIAANTALCVLGVATNTTNILVLGFIAP